MGVQSELMGPSKVILGLVIAIFVLTSPVVAQTPTLVTPQQEIVNALNDETKVYEAYGQFIDRIGDISPEAVQDEFRRNNLFWRDSFSQASLVYEKYASDMSIDQAVREIAQIALRGNSKAIEATESYEKYTESYLSADDMSDEIQSGDTLIQEAVADHDLAVNRYNDYSGASAQSNTLYLIYGFLILASIFSFFLWHKSRANSKYGADIVKAKIFRDLFGNSMWMTIGLAITAGTLHYATINGGSYYILYGPVLIGGWKMLQGLINYFSADRKTLDMLKKQSQEELLNRTIII